MASRYLIAVCASALFPLLASTPQGKVKPKAEPAAPAKNGDCALPGPPKVQDLPSHPYTGFQMLPWGGQAGATPAVLWPRVDPALKDIPFQLGFARLQLAQQELAHADTPAKARAAISRIGRAADQMRTALADAEKAGRKIPVGPVTNPWADGVPAVPTFRTGFIQPFGGR